MPLPHRWRGNVSSYQLASGFNFFFLSFCSFSLFQCKSSTSSHRPKSRRVRNMTVTHLISPSPCRSRFLKWRSRPNACASLYNTLGKTKERKILEQKWGKEKLTASHVRNSRLNHCNYYQK